MECFWVSLSAYQTHFKTFMSLPTLVIFDLVCLNQGLPIVPLPSMGLNLLR